MFNNVKFVFDFLKDLKVAKWRSIMNHVSNIHEGHSEKFPNCLHGDLGDKKWLLKGNTRTVIYNNK
jgi:hypothetical protein